MNSKLDGGLPVSRRTLLVSAAAAFCFGARSRSCFAQAVPVDNRAEFFKNSKVSKFALTITPADLEVMRSDPKKYVKAVLRENDRGVGEVGVRVKGSSTNPARAIGLKPSLSFNMDKFTEGLHFQGMDKLSLEGSLKDPTYLKEFLSAEMYRAAGVPAAMMSHATLTLNGQPRGLYLLKEGYDGGYLTASFGNMYGNFYEGTATHDVDQPLQLHSGKDDVKEQADLKALAAAAREADDGSRFQKLEKLLDLDRFISFIAMEVLTGNRSGYVLKRENYRVYHNPKTDKISFVPSELVGTWKEGKGPLLPELTGMVAKALVETPDGRRRYLDRMKALITKQFNAEVLTKRLSELQERLQPSVTAADAAAGKEFPKQVDALRAVIIERFGFLRGQLDAK